MQVYLYESGFEGLLTAVAAAVKATPQVAGIYAEKQYVPTLFAKPVRIEPDPDQAGRLFAYLQSISMDAARLAVQAFLSEDPEVGNYLREFVRLCLAAGQEALLLHTNDSVRSLLALSRKVDFEAHRLNGMLRFRIMENGVQYAPFQADHNVIGHCAWHFRQRLAGREWILHDLGRSFALYWNKHTLQPVDIDQDLVRHTARFGEIPKTHLTDEERHYQQLWRTFHAAIANPDRENKGLQRRFMPLRYCRFLVEMNG